MSLEQRLEQVERQTKRLRIAVVVLAAALCGVVSMAATERQDGVFDVVTANAIRVKNNEGGTVVAMGSNSNGIGLVSTYNGKIGKELEPLVVLGATDNGGGIVVKNKTGEDIVTLEADDYGNGEVGAWNRKGKGRVWRSQ